MANKTYGIVWHSIKYTKVKICDVTSCTFLEGHLTFRVNLLSLYSGLRKLVTAPPERRCPSTRLQSDTSQKKKLMAFGLVDMHKSFVGCICYYIKILSRIFYLHKWKDRRIMSSVEVFYNRFFAF